ncbi:hypothetical protein CLHUN_33410 [Ruminiclostridium hungatei]|uniref:DUF4397 domain-containing protein n=1 Tax=Ruminiclostridium hungatei TaxID=48256 RepID=A0A1V4SFM9_RUMHU|nr:DUF4397 domain-containing protein [Ruminiclostridium hungatei]OPX42689.1 hypothetical protein CLHUN_33410 [Ruminiclostridium hungatei]
MTTESFYYTDDYSDYDDYTDERQLPGKSHIRVFHAAPGAPEVDIYANGRIIARRLAFGQFTDYITVDAGTYAIEAFPVGLHASPILRVNIPLGAEKVYTLSVIGLLPRIGILPVEDVYEPVSQGRTNIRFINLSPNAPGLSLSLRGGMELFSDISYTEVSNYRPLLPGRYNLIVTPTGTPGIVANLPNVRLLPRRNISFYAVGMFGQVPSSLEVYIPLDGTTYLRDF